MARNSTKRNHRRRNRKSNPPKSSPEDPVDQKQSIRDDLDSIQHNLFHLFVSTISQEEALGIAIAIVHDYTERFLGHRNSHRNLSCLKSSFASRCNAQPNNDTTDQPGTLHPNNHPYALSTTTNTRVTFRPTVSVLDYQPNTIIRNIANVSALAGLIRDYMPDTITVEDATSIALASVNQMH